MFQKIDDFSDLFLGFIDTGHIVKSDPALAFCQKFRLGFAKTHGLAAVALVTIVHRWRDS